MENAKAYEDIPGFEDVAESDNEDFNNGIQFHEGEEAAEDSQTNSNSNSNVVASKEAPSSNDSRQCTPSRTKTKTVSFSQNCYSEEICKVSQHLRNMGNVESSDDSQQVSQPPPGFESGHHRHTSHMETVDKSFNDVTPMEGNKVTSAPLGCVKGLKFRGTKHAQHVRNVKANYKKALLNVPSTSTSTDSTSESLVRLAHESLQIGELLGVKITGDIEAAVSRITKPLKKSKVKEKGPRKERSD